MLEAVTSPVQVVSLYNVLISCVNVLLWRLDTKTRNERIARVVSQTEATADTPFPTVVTEKAEGQEECTSQQTLKVMLRTLRP